MAFGSVSVTAQAITYNISPQLIVSTSFSGRSLFLSLAASAYTDSASLALRLRSKASSASPKTFMQIYIYQHFSNFSSKIFKNSLTDPLQPAYSPTANGTDLTSSNLDKPRQNAKGLRSTRSLCEKYGIFHTDSWFRRVLCENQSDFHTESSCSEPPSPCSLHQSARRSRFGKAARGRPLPVAANSSFLACG